MNRAGIVLGIGGILNHDANAALLVDGRLVASSQEERYTRIKHDGNFPRAAIADCLRQAGLDGAQVPLCVFAEKPLQSLIFDRTGMPTNRFTRWLSGMVPETKLGFPAAARALLPKAEFGYAWHHLSHAAAAFATSPFDRAAFLCVDGKGEDISASIGRVSGEGAEILHELPYEYGLGLLYTLVTYFLGFDTHGSEYKVMGLAPYGIPKFLGRLRAFAPSDDAGALRLRRRVTFKWQVLSKAIEEFGRHLGMPPRTKGAPLTEDHVDLAASIQALFEEEVLKMAEFARKSTGEDQLIFCGGCAQNCVTAGVLRRSGVFRSVYNSPVGGDMGSALGAAVLGWQGQSGRIAKLAHEGFYLGPAPGEVPAEALAFAVAHAGNIHEATARLLADGKVVGWVRGRMELGARALGARSILADPRGADMQSVLNLKVKFRESFRPFAPAVLAEECGRWFDTTEPSDFMQYTAYLLPQHRRPVPAGLKGLAERRDFRRCDMPSVVHVDFSARIQTVRSEVHPDFHRLISEFRDLTGIPMVINTSFNVSGQPIVCTAAEAWQCFRHTDMDYLVVGERIFRNPNDRTREQKLAWLKQFENYS